MRRIGRFLRAVWRDGWDTPLMALAYLQLGVTLFGVASQNETVILAGLSLGVGLLLALLLFIACEAARHLLRRWRESA